MQSEAVQHAARPIAAAFERARTEGRAALITFLAGGDPDLAATERLAFAAADAGADIIELGVPFTDPLADGPVIQAAYTRALAAGVTLSGLFATVERIVRATGLPVVLMTSFNPVVARGVDRFCHDARSAGAAGILVPDLLPEDALELRAAAVRHGVDTVFLVAPGAPEHRLRAAASASTGFLYLVSRRGITGTHAGPGDDLESDIARARAITTLPVAVGFGVTAGVDAARVAGIADGVIVGTAIVAAVEGALERAADERATAIHAVGGAVTAVRRVVHGIGRNLRWKDALPK